MGRAAHQGGQGLRLRPDGRGGRQVPRRRSRPGKDSPYRNRSVEENLDLFRRMKAGEFPDGARTLRAKIDMNSPNFNMRDPVMYRILHAQHHRTGDKWCIYPMYDWAHGQSDSIEGITHSICTLEFENHRPLYDWFIDAAGHLPSAADRVRPAQPDLHGAEQAPADPAGARKSTSAAGTTRGCRRSSGMRRRGYTPEAIRKFCERIGVSKFDGVIDMAWLEDALREDLNKQAPRVMAVLRPLQGGDRELPRRPDRGAGRGQQSRRTRRPARARCRSRACCTSSRTISARTRPRSSSAWRPGREVRLRYAYFVKCIGVDEGPEDRRGRSSCAAPTTRPPAAATRPDGRKVKGTIHWVVGRSRARRRGAAVRPPVHEARTRTTCRRGRTTWRT